MIRMTSGYHQQRIRTLTTQIGDLEQAVFVLTRLQMGRPATVKDLRETIAELRSVRDIHKADLTEMDAGQDDGLETHPGVNA